MNDDEWNKIMQIEGTLAALLDDYVGNNLRGRIAGLTWSPRMPDNDPDAELLVVDEEGVEYVLDIDVDLSPTGRKKDDPIPEESRVEP